MHDKRLLGQFDALMSEFRDDEVSTSEVKSRLYKYLYDLHEDVRCGMVDMMENYANFTIDYSDDDPDVPKAKKLATPPPPVQPVPVPANVAVGVAEPGKNDWNFT